MKVKTMGITCTHADSRQGYYMEPGRISVLCRSYWHSPCACRLLEVSNCRCLKVTFTQTSLQECVARAVLCKQTCCLYQSGVHQHPASGVVGVKLQPVKDSFEASNRSWTCLRAVCDCRGRPEPGRQERSLAFS